MRGKRILSGNKPLAKQLFENLLTLSSRKQSNAALERFAQNITLSDPISSRSYRAASCKHLFGGSYHRPRLLSNHSRRFHMTGQPPTASNVILGSSDCTNANNLCPKRSRNREFLSIMSRMIQAALGNLAVKTWTCGVSELAHFLRGFQYH